MNPDAHSRTLLVCRTGFEEALCAELRERLPGATAARLDCGLVLARAERTRWPAEALTFERQRLPDVASLPAADLKPIDEQVWRRVMAGVLAGEGPWTLHAFAGAEEAAAGLHRRVGGVANTLLRLTRKHHTLQWKLHRAQASGRQCKVRRVLQLCLTDEALWFSACDRGALSSGAPAGRYRLRADPRAPSRSYLKLEEAFMRMDAAPQPGDRVVDLGGAPGGWTFACMKRGARVTMVDHGRLKLPPREEGSGEVTWEAVDGIGYAPPQQERPLDWMVADMLVPPGVALGLLRQWMAGRWARYLVVNVKLPQREPQVAVAPLQAFLRAQAGWQGEVRQLYHDRREVTVMARCE